MDQLYPCAVKARRKIATWVKLLTYLDGLPKDYASRIHRSQLSRYRNHFDPKEYFGYELADIGADVIEQVRQINQFRTDRMVVSGYLRLATFFRRCFYGIKGYKSVLRKNKDELVEIVQMFRDVIPVSRFAALLKLDESTLRNWIRQVRVQCSDSVINLCRKVHPNQLLQREVQAMKKLLADPRFRFWPLKSVYYYALNNNIVSMALSTWYRYAGLLHVKRLKPFSAKTYGLSVRATFPNEIWHADVSYYKTRDGLLHYIYSVVDNYSRFPLVVKVSTKLSGKIRMQTFRDALAFTIQHYPDTEMINLVVDGGSENFNGSVDEFLANLDHIPIHRIRALKDVAYSNSVAEAFFRTLKCSYLNHITVEDTAMAELKVAWVREDFAYKRPHGLLIGLTPYQAWLGCRPEQVSFDGQLAAARKVRVEGKYPSYQPHLVKRG